jgi:protein tyrosine phosphatase
LKFNLLHNYNATHLVRLTPAKEGGHEKCYPYWDRRDELTLSTQEHYLNIPLESEENNPEPYKLRYVAIDTWKDHQSGDPDALLGLILQARKGHDSSSLMAVHCHSGVARTGTFISGFLLLDEIDRHFAEKKTLENLNISIEKTVMQLSLQRFYMVGKPEQYLTLYRLVDLYVNKLQQEKT